MRTYILQYEDTYIAVRVANSKAPAFALFSHIYIYIYIIYTYIYTYIYLYIYIYTYTYLYIELATALTLGDGGQQQVERMPYALWLMPSGFWLMPYGLRRHLLSHSATACSSKSSVCDDACAATALSAYVSIRQHTSAAS